MSRSENLPLFLAHVQQVEILGAGRIRVRGEVAGRPFHTEATWHIEPDERIMHWATESPFKYRGALQVSGSEMTSRLNVTLTFEQDEQERDRFGRETHEGKVMVHDRLVTSLESIKRIFERSASHANKGNLGFLG